MQKWDYTMSEIEYVNLGEYGCANIRKYEYGDGSPNQYQARVWKQKTGEDLVTDLHPTIGLAKQEVAKIIFG